MNNWRLLVFVLFLHFETAGQNTIGIPNIVNYSKMAYQAGSQNWSIAQDEQGIMYFANTDGLLSFDGVFWRLYPLPNKTVVRSVAAGRDNRIYVGGQKEIGFFSPGKNGDLEYTSLNKLLAPAEDDFADVWNICFHEGHVFFRANKRIFDFFEGRIKAYHSPNWGFLGTVGKELIAFENENGLLRFENGSWRLIVSSSRLPVNVMIRSALAIGKDSILLVSLVNGLYILHNGEIKPFVTPDLERIAPQNIASTCLLSPERIALSTNLAGCIIIDREGNFIQRLTKQEGIQNNNVRVGFSDRDKNLWLALDNGIDLVTYSNAIRNIFPDREDRNSGYTSLIYQNELFLGVSTGVYRISLNSGEPDISYTNGQFSWVENSDGQVWNLANVNGMLLMGHNKGGFRLQNDKAIPIDTRTGFWAFHPLQNVAPSSVILAGTYSGVTIYNGADSIAVNRGRVLPLESARFIGKSKDVIWIAHPYKGLYAIRFKNGVPTPSVYPDRKKILSSNHNKIFQLKDRVLLTTDNGIFEYDERKEDFVRASWFERLAGPVPVSYIKEDERGNIWFCRDRKVGIIDRSGTEARVIFIPEIDGRITASGFENINIIDSSNVLIAAEKGFFHINYALYKKEKQPLRAMVRRVQSPLRDQSLVFGGYLAGHDEPSLSYKHNALHFECSSTIFGQEQNTEFSYFLVGFDRDWSPWTKKRERDYTNLPAGHYEFRVKCRNNFDNESPVASFSFEILPPWYQTWWAYIIYIAVFLGLLYFFYKRQQQKYRRQQQRKLAEQRRKYEEEQNQLQMQHELEIRENEKQIIQLKNEKLQAEVEHKNTELASSAMNLVRKREMLSRLKENLILYKQGAEAEKAGKDFQKIIKSIDKELDHNEEWEQFAVHFDSVHTNYLKKLKEQFPDLTISDLKLAAYLRLNLSSKEIAQLLNISIRGVETSRYRLRKKMNLSNETGLFDFLIQVTS